MTRIALAAFLIAAASPALAGEPYPFELAERAPALAKGLAAVTPDVSGTGGEWLGRLKGTSGPLREVFLDGRRWYAGYVCRPHACNADRFVFLLAPDGSTGHGMLRLSGRRRPFATGAAPGPEAKADLLERLDPGAVGTSP